MSLSLIPLEAISVHHLQNLVDNKVPEWKTIEYKQSLPGNRDSDRTEFLADVSSFANAGGGDLIYGIAARQGKPTSICGLSINDADSECLRLESMIRDGIRPRIFGCSARSISLTPENIVIILRISRSLSLPHMVIYKGHGRFYSRGSNGKYPLDVDELRAAFAFSETAAERIRSFRAERLTNLIAGEAPVRLPDVPKIVLHCIPLGAFAFGQRIKVSTSELDKVLSYLCPLYNNAFSYRYNFDGFLTYTKGDDSNQSYGYVQLFSNGIIEAVDASLLRVWKEGGKTPYISSPYFEEDILKALSRFVTFQQYLNIELPLVVMVSLMGVSGYVIATVQNPLRSSDVRPIDRDNLLIPEVMIEDFLFKPESIMRSIFDAIWNASGWSHCMNYDQSGEWKPR